MLDPPGYTQRGQAAGDTGCPRSPNDSPEQPLGVGRLQYTVMDAAKDAAHPINYFYRQTDRQTYPPTPNSLPTIIRD